MADNQLSYVVELALLPRKIKDKETYSGQT